MKLPEKMRAELKVPLGLLLTGEPEETTSRLREILQERRPLMYAVVGDFTSMNILNSGLEPDICVIDHRVMRIDVDPLNHKERRIYNADNPAGTITRESWAVLREAVSLKFKASVIVEGEEDLLVLPLISLMPEGSLIVYGQPREGMVVVEVTEERRLWAEEFMTHMEEC